MSSKGTDIVVVGGGIVGAAVTLRLAGEGWTVTTIDLHEPVDSATCASGAMLGVLGEVTPDETADDLALRVASWQRYPAWMESMAQPLTSGTFIIAGPGRAHDLASLEAMRQAATKHDLRTETVHPSDISELASTPGFWPTSALYLPDEAWVDGPSLRRAMLDAAARSGHATFINDQVDRILHSDGIVHGVRTCHGDSIHADHVVLCVGAAVPTLLQQSGLDTGLVPRLVPAKGVGLVLSGDAGPVYRHVLRTPNRQFACGLHLVPRGEHSVYIGSTNRVGSRLPGSSGRVTAGEVTQLLTDAIQEFSAPLSEWELTRTVHGFRPLPMDGLPIAGRTALDGLSVATGTYRNGVLLAPLMADVVKADLAHEPSPTPIDISPRRSIAPANAVAVLRHGLAELIDHWHHHANARWYELVAPLVDKLATIACGTDPVADGKLHELMDFLRDHGRPEMVPEAVIALISST